MIPWMNIAIAAIPEVASLIQAIRGLRKKFPQLTVEQIAAMVSDVTGQADSEFDRVLAEIAADQAKPAA